jgi:hypothetical protein
VRTDFWGSSFYLKHREFCKWWAGPEAAERGHPRQHPPASGPPPWALKGSASSRTVREALGQPRVRTYAEPRRPQAREGRESARHCAMHRPSLAAAAFSSRNAGHSGRKLLGTGARNSRPPPVLPSPSRRRLNASAAPLGDYGNARAAGLTGAPIAASRNDDRR